MRIDRQVVTRWILASLTDSRNQRVLLAALLAVLLFAGLHPFNFIPRNQVAWLQGRHGVEFHGYGEVRGAWNPGFLAPANSEGSGAGFTLELRVQCSRMMRGAKDLVIVSHDVKREPFSVLQYGSL